MGKVYLYKGRRYSDDYWSDFDGNDFDGSLWDLLEALAEDKSTKLEQHTYTFFTLDGEQVADDNDGVEEDLIDDMIAGGYLDHTDLEVEEPESDEE